MVTIVTAQVISNPQLCTAIKQHKLNFKKMKKNMGTADRIIRVIIAAIVGVLYFTGTVTGTLGIVLLILAGIFVLTSVISFCPLYAPFGINTCATKK
jgi:hypothetical protein